jgi:dihydrofolate synthase/folylpolyglutamate synthase
LQVGNARLVIACQPESPRAVPAARIAEVAKEMGVLAVTIEDARVAVNEAIAMATQDDLVVITGSLHIVGAAREAVFARQ